MKRLISAIAIAMCVASVSIAAEPAGQAEQVQAAVKAVTPAASESININTASAEELARGLHGVGMAKAQAIIEFRDLNGPFAAAEELSQVKGLGPATVEKNEAVIGF